MASGEGSLDSENYNFTSHKPTRNKFFFKPSDAQQNKAVLATALASAKVY